MSGHTPGPWAAFYKHKYNEWHVSIPISGSSMKRALFDDGIKSANPEADCHLIAAAPDLLQALIDVLPYAEACIGSAWRKNPPSDSVIAAAHEAIAKALGTP